MEYHPFGSAYRPCVGLMVVNDRGLVFAGRRSGVEDSPHAWQMPQGGIDHGETPEQAAWRELKEETSITDAALLAESTNWLKYDLPDSARGHRDREGHNFTGQAQKWFVFGFLGKDQDIDLNAHHEIEFSDWDWREAAELPDLVIPFKRGVYRAVVEEFQPCIDRWKMP